MKKILTSVHYLVTEVLLIVCACGNRKLLTFRNKEQVIQDQSIQLQALRHRNVTVFHLVEELHNPQQVSASDQVLRTRIPEFLIQRESH